MSVRAWRPVMMIALAFLSLACARKSSDAQAAASSSGAIQDAPAPATFRARFETTAGTFVIEVQRDWAPRGADRFYTLVKSGYYDGVRFFRVISGFMAQFGIHGDPKVSAVWHERTIPDDPVRQSNARGMVTYATAGPGTRTT